MAYTKVRETEKGPACSLFCWRCVTFSAPVQEKHVLCIPNMGGIEHIARKQRSVPFNPS